MKYILLSGLILGTLLGGCKTTSIGNGNQTNMYQVSGTITYTSDYCGGAAPPEELLNQLKTPTPYMGKILHIRAAQTNDFSKPILHTLVTDSLGHFSVSLPPGNYCMIDDFRKDGSFVQTLNKKNNLSTNNQQCVDDWLNSCLYSFTVTQANITNIQLNIHRICFVPEGVPCVSYDGPLPQ
jgi:hypothetical protein